MGTNASTMQHCTAGQSVGRSAYLNDQVIFSDLAVANEATQGCDRLLSGVKLGLCTVVTVLLAHLVHLQRKR